jgi:hypothetical protein
MVFFGTPTLPLHKELLPMSVHMLINDLIDECDFGCGYGDWLQKGDMYGLGAVCW